MTLLLIFAIANVIVSQLTYIASYIIKPELFAKYRKTLYYAFVADAALSGCAFAIYLVNMFLTA